MAIHACAQTPVSIKCMRFIHTPRDVYGYTLLGKVQLGQITPEKSGQNLFIHLERSVIILNAIAYELNF